MNIDWAELFGYKSSIAQNVDEIVVQEKDIVEDIVDLPKEGQSDLSEEDLEEVAGASDYSSDYQPDGGLPTHDQPDGVQPVLCKLDINCPELFDNMTATEMETDTGSVLSDSSSTSSTDEDEINITPVDEISSASSEADDEEMDDEDGEYEEESDSEDERDVPYRLRTPAMPDRDCKWCKASFMSRSELDEHYNSCELYIKAVRHYTCKCGKICVNLNGFKTHKRFCKKSVKQIVKFECLACPKRFDTRTHRNKHHIKCKIMQALSKKDRYVCPFCKRVFRTNRSRGQHYHGCRKTSRAHQAKYIYQ
tara:strand:- start:77 stop:997 length:921 start_codon:yes stop_codon:yes gene_type:complete